MTAWFAEFYRKPPGRADGVALRAFILRLLEAMDESDLNGARVVVREADLARLDVEMIVAMFRCTFPAAARIAEWPGKVEAAASEFLVRGLDPDILLRGLRPPAA